MPSLFKLKKMGIEYKPESGLEKMKSRGIPMPDKQYQTPNVM